MSNTSKRISKRDIHFFRRLNRNMVFGEIVSYFAQQAEHNALTQREIARRLGKDAGQVNRWLSEPSNLTLDSISDLLLGMDAEMEVRVVPASGAPSVAGFMDEFTDWVSESHATTKVVSIPPAPPKISGTNSAAVARIGERVGRQAFA